MTPDRREELRRCDDACYRTRTSREIDELKERIKALENILGNAHDCLNNLSWYADSYEEKKWALDIVDDIDAMLPATEGKKDE